MSNDNPVMFETERPLTNHHGLADTEVEIPRDYCPGPFDRINGEEAIAAGAEAARLVRHLEDALTQWYRRGGNFWGQVQYQRGVLDERRRWEKRARKEGWALEETPDPTVDSLA